jgi:soluble lytic murein transglycosylase-like protein
MIRKKFQAGDTVTPVTREDVQDAVQAGLTGAQAGDPEFIPAGATQLTTTPKAYEEAEKILGRVGQTKGEVEDISRGLEASAQKSIAALRGAQQLMLQHYGQLMPSQDELAMRSLNAFARPKPGVGATGALGAGVSAMTEEELAQKAQQRQYLQNYLDLISGRQEAEAERGITEQTAAARIKALHDIVQQETGMGERAITMMGRPLTGTMKFLMPQSPEGKKAYDVLGGKIWNPDGTWSDAFSNKAAEFVTNEQNRIRSMYGGDAAIETPAQQLDLANAAGVPVHPAGATDWSRLPYQERKVQQDAEAKAAVAEQKLYDDDFAQIQRAMVALNEFEALNAKNPTTAGILGTGRYGINIGAGLHGAAVHLGPEAGIQLNPYHMGNPAYDLMDKDAATIISTAVVPTHGFGRVTNRDLGLFSQAAPGTDKATAVNMAVIKSLRATLQATLDQRAFNQAYYKRHLTMTGAEQAWQDYYDANPVFDRTKPPDESGLPPLVQNRMGWQEYFRNQNMGGVPAGTPAAPAPRPAAPPPPNPQILSMIDGIANKYGVPPAIARSVAQQESSFDPTNSWARKNPNVHPGDKGFSSSRGLFGLVDRTIRHYGVRDPLDPQQSAEAGIRYLRELHDTYGGDWHKALAAYGEGDPYATQVLGRVGRAKGGRVQMQQGGQVIGDSDRQPDIWSDKKPQPIQAGIASTGVGQQDFGMPATENLGRSLNALKEGLTLKGGHYPEDPWTSHFFSEAAGALPAAALAALALRFPGVRGWAEQHPHLAGATAGAGLGGIAGHLGGTGVMPGMIVGGAAGLGTEPVVTGAAERLARLGNRLTWPGQLGPGVRQSLDIMAREPGGVAGVAGRFGEDVRAGVPSTIAEAAGPRSVGLTEHALRRDTPAGNVLTQALQEREEQMGGRAGETVNRALGPQASPFPLAPEDYHSRMTQLRGNLAANAEPVYEQAFQQFPQPAVPSFARVMNTPGGAAATREALTTMQNMGWNVQGMVENPSLRFLDQVRRGLERGAATAPDEFNRNALMDMRNRLIGEMDQATMGPDGQSLYRHARDRYAGDEAMINALRSGHEEFPGMTPAQVQQHVAGLNWSERDAFRTGVAENLLRQIGGTADARNAAQGVIGNPDVRAKIMSIFENPNDGQGFIDNLSRQADLFPTGRQMAGAGEQALRTSGVPASRIGRTPVLGRIVRGLTSTELPPKAAGQVAETMGTMATDPEAMANMRRLQGKAEALQRQKAASQFLGRAAAGAAGAAATPPFYGTPQQQGQPQ